MTSDIINGGYKFLLGFFIFLNCVQLWKDKTVKGVRISPFICFALGSLWDLYYYPHLNQWVSLMGACHIVVWNIIWVILALYYTRRNRFQR